MATRSRREAFNSGSAPAAETLRFGFEKVLRDATQQDVFDAAAADAVAAALQGYNAAVRPPCSANAKLLAYLSQLTQVTPPFYYVR